MTRIEAEGTNGSHRNIPNSIIDNTNRIVGNNGTANMNFDRILNEKRGDYNPYQNQNQEKPENLDESKNNEDQEIIHPFLGHNFDGRF